MNRLEFLTIREQLMENIDAAVDDTDLPQDTKDGLVTELCDLICERLDPVGMKDE